MPPLPLNESIMDDCGERRNVNVFLLLQSIKLKNPATSSSYGCLTGGSTQ
jgi:hypothetical protein